jgi:hypothetical protein
VYRTIVKNLHHIWILKNKRELRNQQSGSLKRLKRNAPEDKSAPEDKVLLKMMTSSEAEVHQKQVHQKQKITRS